MLEAQTRLEKNPPKPIGERRSRQADHVCPRGLHVIHPNSHLNVRFVDNDQISVRPSAFSQSLRTGDLKRTVLVVSPMVGHQDGMRSQTIRVGDCTRLLDQGTPVAYENGALALCSASWIARSPRNVFPLPVGAINIWHRCPLRAP